MMARSQEEFRFSCVVADWLRRALPSRALWTHFPAGEHRTAITGARLKRMGMARGWPDYLVVYEGRLFGLELKVGKGALSDEQEAIADRFQDNACPWTCARSLDDVEAFFRANDVPIRARVAA